MRLSAGALCCLMMLALAAPADERAGASAVRPLPTKRVSYQGYVFRVPVAWPVVHDERHPRGCVRFDQHAVYLGVVNSAEFCPSWLLGTTESILIQPGPARTVSSSTEDLVAREITVRAPRIKIMATFDADPMTIDRILASARLPAPLVVPPNPMGQPDSSVKLADRREPQAAGMHYPMAAPPLPATVTSYIGLGFDSCAAPSRRYMRAWLRRSPYRAVGIYIGGADRACAQPNLSRRWVTAEARAGWRFMPLYAGPQAAFGELGPARRQGRAAARDAVMQARRLGFGPRTPLYYDMEAFGRRASELPVLRFLSAWTRELHRLGFASGVYSSSDSGIVDLARHYRSRRFAMPNIIFDALWNGSRSTSDRHLGARQWRRHKRIHQFRGNVTKTFGGRTLNVDVDFLNVRVTAGEATAQQTSAVSLPGGRVMVFYRRRGDHLWLDRYARRGGWARPVATGADASSQPSAVWTGSAVAVFYKDSSGSLRVRDYRPDGRLAGRRRLAMMGVLGGSPRAVSQPDGVIDVFWRGSADDHLWHGQYTPGSGWNGPQGLGGSLSSGPSPVTSTPGHTSVFWRGADRRLWTMTRGLAGRWSPPHSLGMAPLGGSPQATAQTNGGIEVYWSGSGNPYLWEGFYGGRTGWRGPRDLGGRIGSAPWPATAAGTVRVLWQGPGHQLDFIAHSKPRRGWNVLSWTAPNESKLGWVAAPPYAAVGSQGAGLHVFWRGRGDSLWTASLTGARLARPVRLS